MNYFNFIYIYIKNITHDVQNTEYLRMFNIVILRL